MKRCDQCGKSYKESEGTGVVDMTRPGNFGVLNLCNKCAEQYARKQWGVELKDTARSFKKKWWQFWK